MIRNQDNAEAIYSAMGPCNTSEMATKYPMIKDELDRHTGNSGSNKVVQYRHNSASAKMEELTRTTRHHEAITSIIFYTGERFMIECLSDMLGEYINRAYQALS